MKRKRFISNFIIGAIVIIGVTVCNPITVQASDRENLKDKINEQEEILQDELKPFNPNINDSWMHDTLDSYLEQDIDGEFDVQGITDGFQNALFTLLIKTRTGTILLYAAVVVLCTIYMATMGSRDINRRRQAYLLLRNATVTFFIYINIPLFLIWLNADKSQLANLSIFNIVYDMLEFLQTYSIVIAALILYSGITKLIISRNDLPIRMQGKYLVKFGGFLFMFLNIAPRALSFLV